MEESPLEEKIREALPKSPDDAMTVPGIANVMNMSKLNEIEKIRVGLNKIVGKNVNGKGTVESKETVEPMGACRRSAKRYWVGEVPARSSLRLRINENKISQDGTKDELGAMEKARNFEHWERDISSEFFGAKSVLEQIESGALRALCQGDGMSVYMCEQCTLLVVVGAKDALDLLKLFSILKSKENIQLTDHPLFCLPTQEKSKEPPITTTEELVRTVNPEFVGPIKESDPGVRPLPCADEAMTPMWVDWLRSIPIFGAFAFDEFYKLYKKRVKVDKDHGAIFATMDDKPYLGAAATLPMMAGSLQSKDHLDHNFAHLHTDPGCGTGSPLHADVMAGYSYGGHKAFPVGGDKKGKRPSSRAFCAAGGYVLTGNKAFAFIRQDQHSKVVRKLAGVSSSRRNFLARHAPEVLDFYDAMDNSTDGRSPQVPGIFQGVCCAGDLTHEELKNVGVACSHIAGHGVGYYIPEKVFHMVINENGKTADSVAADFLLSNTADDHLRRLREKVPDGNWGQQVVRNRRSNRLRSKDISS